MGGLDRAHARIPRGARRASVVCPSIRSDGGASPAAGVAGRAGRIEPHRAPGTRCRCGQVPRRCTSRSRWRRNGRSGRGPGTGCTSRTCTRWPVERRRSWWQKADGRSQRWTDEPDGGADGAGARGAGWRGWTWWPRSGRNEVGGWYRTRSRAGGLALGSRSRPAPHPDVHDLLHSAAARSATLGNLPSSPILRSSSRAPVCTCSACPPSARAGSRSRSRSPMNQLSGRIDVQPGNGLAIEPEAGLAAFAGPGDGREVGTVELQVDVGAFRGELPLDLARHRCGIRLRSAGRARCRTGW